MANDKKPKAESESKLSNEKKAEQVIDNFCAKKEESYDKFMESFSMLKKDDVIKKLMTDLSEDMKSESMKSKKDFLQKSYVASKNKVASEEDGDVETEVLLEGNIVGSMSSEKTPAGKKFVQFDNFLEDIKSTCNDESDDDIYNELEEGGYVASFNHKDNASSELIKTDVKKNSDEDVCTNDNIENKLMPGEAEDDNVGSLNRPVINTTQIDLSSRLKPDLNLDTSTTLCENSTDDVVPFSLDKDFDYNNVILTPKWTGLHQPPGFSNET